MNTAILATGGPSEQLMTLVLIGIGLEAGEASYLNAGHHPLLWSGANTEVVLQAIRSASARRRTLAAATSP